MNILDPSKYSTFLESRPEDMENQAIELVIKLCREYRYVSRQGTRKQLQKWQLLLFFSLSLLWSLLID